MMPSPEQLAGWAQFAFWCVGIGVAVSTLLLLGRFAALLERWELMAAAMKAALVAARFLPDARAADAAPSTFPPRRSQPNAVALERRHEERRADPSRW